MARHAPGSGVVGKPRPPWLRALGASDPPGVIAVDGAVYRCAEIYKHDSWAATALYEAEDGRRLVCKFHRQRRIGLLPMGWFGRRMARHEAAMLDRLADVPGVPRRAGVVRIGSRALRFAVARAYIAGHPLRKAERVDDRFFPRLEALLGGIHARRLAYVDLHKRENIIVGEDGRPHLVDFQIGVAWPRWLPSPLLRILQRSDDYHLSKHWAACRPDQCDPRRAAQVRNVPWFIRAHRLVGRPFRALRRGLLVRLDVRSGRGMAETEAFPEAAVRDAA
jgi:hypothetical protein